MRVTVKMLSILLSLILIISVFTIIPAGAAAIVEYIDKEWDAAQQKVVDTPRTITDYTRLNSGMTTLSTGMYVVDSNINYSKRLNIAGNANVGIILCNGYTLENNKGIIVPESSRLTFYGQRENNGTVNVYNADGAAIGALDEQKTGRLVFEGGHIIAKGGRKDAGIGTGKNRSSGFIEINVLGGLIEATGGEMGPGIGAGRENSNNYAQDINIYGGTIKATGGSCGAGIGGGEDSAVNRINIYGGDITAKGGEKGAGIGTGNSEDNHGTINIYGGNVDAQGGNYGAGIGGGDYGDSGTINISGGNVKAHGGENAAGIGSGEDCDVDNITISGGKVCARSSDGAGIGSAEDGKMGNITITGGDVRAMSKRGAGIGGGYDEHTQGVITITGGEVYAVSSCGAGIGAGMRSDLKSPIYIKGGTVHAKSGVVYNDNEFLRLMTIIAENVPLLDFSERTYEGGAGIGCGSCGNQQGTIYIEGGTVFAYGAGFELSSPSAYGGAGIGAGVEQIDPSHAKNPLVHAIDALFDSEAGTGGEGGPVQITGGIVLAAARYEACAIGYGELGDELGELTLPSDYTVYSLDSDAIGIEGLVETVKSFTGVSDSAELLAAYDDLKSKGYLEHSKTNDRVKACQGQNRVVLIMPCHHFHRTYDITEETHTMYCQSCEVVERDQPHLYSKGVCECSLYNNVINKFTHITFTDLISTKAYPTLVGSQYELPQGNDTAPDENGMVKKFIGWTNGGNVYLPGEKVTVTENMTFGYQYEDQYLIKVAEAENGTLRVNREIAPEGAEITITPQPQPGYRLKNLWYIRKDHGTGETLELDQDSNRCTVMMPPTQLTLHAEFEKINYAVHRHEDGTEFVHCLYSEELQGTGNYYLVSDMTLPSAALSAGDTLKICLNGYTLTVPQDFTIPQGAELSIYDDSDKGIVTGGTINVSGTFNLYGGNLTGFTNGAVFVNTTGVFNLYGGRIENNTAASVSGGVYVAQGEMNIYGDAIIYNNTVTDASGGTSNVNVMLYDTAIIIKGELTEDALIGVSVLNAQYYPYAVTSALDGKASEHTFISDSDDVFTDYNSAEDRIDLNMPFTLNFIANGGSGEMANEVIKDKNYFIPGCGFTAPEGMAFKCWLIDGEEYYPGDPYTVTYNQAAIAYAVWGSLYTVTVNETFGGTVTASAAESIEGETITLTVTPIDRYDVKKVCADGEEIIPENGVYRFTMPSHDVIVSAEFIKTRFFVHHSISLRGDICINYYVDLSDEEVASGAAVDFSWIVNKAEKTHTVTLTEEDKTVNGYRAAVPVAVAEMTNDVTATLTIGGKQVDTDIYSVKRYGDTVLTDSFMEEYLQTHTHSDYEKFSTLIKAMLDYGTKAQLEFNRNVRHLANKGVDYTMEDVSGEMITTTPSDMDSGLESYGLQYEGSTIVYLTKTSLRHYYSVTDQERFDAVKNHITFDGEKASAIKKGGMIYFEKKDIAAADLDTPYTLTIGENSYDYCVLDYVRECLNAEDVPAATYMLVSATYWYNQAANAYFG